MRKGNVIADIYRGSRNSATQSSASHALVLCKTPWHGYHTSYTCSYTCGFSSSRIAESKMLASNKTQLKMVTVNGCVLALSV